MLVRGAARLAPAANAAMGSVKAPAVKLGTLDGPPKPAFPTPDESLKPSRRDSFQAAFPSSSRQTAPAQGGIPFGARGFHASASMSDVQKHYSGPGGSLKIDFKNANANAHMYDVPNPEYEEACALAKRNNAHGAVAEFGAGMGETLTQLSRQFPNSPIVAVELRKEQATAITTGLEKRSKAQQKNISVQNAGTLDGMAKGSTALVVSSRVMPYLDQKALTAHSRNLERVLVPGGVAHFNFYHESSSGQFRAQLQGPGGLSDPVMTASGMLSALGVGPGKPLELVSCKVHIEMTIKEGEQPQKFAVPIPSAELAKMEDGELDTLISSEVYDKVMEHVPQSSPSTVVYPFKMEVRPEIIAQKPLSNDS